MRGYESAGSICSGGRYDNLASSGTDGVPGRRHLDRRVPHARAAVRRRRADDLRDRCRRACCRVARRRVPAGVHADRGGAAGAGDRDRGGAGAGEVRQADPVRRPAGHPVRLVPRRRRRPRSRTSAPATSCPPTRQVGCRRPPTCNRKSDNRRPWRSLCCQGRTKSPPRSGGGRHPFPIKAAAECGRSPDLGIVADRPRRESQELFARAATCRSAVPCRPTTLRISMCWLPSISTCTRHSSKSAVSVAPAARSHR